MMIHKSFSNKELDKYHKYEFIFNTGRKGGKLQRAYGLELMSTYYVEYYKDDRNLLITFNKIKIGKNGKVELCAIKK
jgi:hypothetical protein